MKKLLSILVSLLAAPVFAQANDLHDINFDAPTNNATYDENQQMFQQVYLQYESAIKILEDTIRNDEKNIRQNEIKLVKEEETQKLRAELSESLEKQRREIYENEIEAVRTQERERLTEEIRNAVFEELTEKFTVSYEEKKNQEIEALKERLAQQVYEEQKENFDKELRAQISLENERIAELYKTEIKEELAKKYEIKKNDEIKAYKKEWAREFFKENKIWTERMQFFTPYIMYVIYAIMAFVLIFLLSIVILRKKAKDEKLEYYAGSYLNRMKQYAGKTAIFETIKQIRDEIDNSSESEAQKSILREAIGIAEEKYKTYKATLPISEYKQLFKDLDTQKIFNDWNLAEDDESMKKGLCNDFISNINGYTETAIDALNSKNEEGDIKQMLEVFSSTLKNTSEQVKYLARQETNDAIKKNLESIAQKYAELAKNFEKGAF